MPVESRTSHESVNRLPKGSRLLLALLAIVTAAGCTSDFVTRVDYPNLKAPADCQPDLGNSENSGQLPPGVIVLPDQQILTSRDTLSFICTAPNQAKLVGPVGLNYERDLPVNPVVADFVWQGYYHVQITTADCGFSRLRFYDDKDHYLGASTGSEYCDTAEQIFPVIHDSEPPIITNVSQEEGNGAVVVSGKVEDGSGQPIAFHGLRNGARFEPVMVDPGKNFKIAMPLVPGTNKVSLKACDVLDNCTDIVWGSGLKDSNYQYNPLKDMLTVPSIDAKGRLVVEIMAPNVHGSLLPQGLSLRASQESYLLTQAFSRKIDCELAFQPNLDPNNPKLTYIKATCDKPDPKGQTKIHLEWQDRVGNTLQEEIVVPSEMIPPIKESERQVAWAMLLATVVAGFVGAGIGMRGLEYKASLGRQRKFNEAIWTNDLIGASRQIAAESGALEKKQCLEEALALSYIGELVSGRANKWLASFQQATERPNQGLINLSPALHGASRFRFQEFEELEELLKNSTGCKLPIYEVDVAEQVKRANLILEMFGRLYQGEEPPEIITVLRRQRLVEILPVIQLALKELINHQRECLKQTVDLTENQTINEYRRLAELLCDLSRSDSWLRQELQDLRHHNQAVSELATILDTQFLAEALYARLENREPLDIEFLQAILGRNLQRLPELMRILQNFKDYSLAEVVLAVLPDNSQTKKARIMLIQAQK